MAMPGRNSHAGQGSYSSSTTVVSGNSYPTDLVITDRYNATPAEYKAATSIEFVGEYVDNGNDEYIAYIVDGNNPDPHPLSGNGTISGNSYRYGFNGQEKSDDVTDGNYTAEFWEYDSRIGRRWNVDPVPKVYESPYCVLGNSPISVKDPNGADSLFYNQDGSEARRVTFKGENTYWLQHNNGNIKIGDKNYFQGNSYYSFFGDPSKPKQTLFNKVDKSLGNIKNEINCIVENKYDGESHLSFWTNSGGHDKFDYKNDPMFGENSTTAYLIEGKLYNRNEMGMIFWGATAAKTGVSWTKLAIWNSAITYQIEGNGDEYNEVKCWSLGFNIMKSQDVKASMTMAVANANRYFGPKIDNMTYQGEDYFKGKVGEEKYGTKNKFEWSHKTLINTILCVALFNN